MAKRWWLGFSFLVVTIIASFVVEAPKKGQLIWLDQAGKVAGEAPFTPFQVPPFGTDAKGIALGWRLLEGAKTTLLSMLIVSAVQLVVAVCLTALLYYMPAVIQRAVRSVAQSYFYVPTMVLLVILLPLVGVLPFKLGSFPYIAAQLALFVLMLAPPLALLLLDELERLMKEDYVMSARLLGASRWRILRHHLAPHLRSYTFILHWQQCVQTLLFFAQLSLFHIYIGGHTREFDFVSGTASDALLAYEWAGMMGN